MNTVMHAERQGCVQPSGRDRRLGSLPWREQDRPSAHVLDAEGNRGSLTVTSITSHSFTPNSSSTTRMVTVRAPNIIRTLFTLNGRRHKHSIYSSLPLFSITRQIALRRSRPVLCSPQYTLYMTPLYRNSRFGCFWSTTSSFTTLAGIRLGGRGASLGATTVSYEMVGTAVSTPINFLILFRGKGSSSSVSLSSGSCLSCTVSYGMRLKKV